MEESGQPQVLSGSTALFHKSDIPDEVDLFMAFADASFIAQILARWAKRFKVKWHVRMNDEDWGSIDPTGLSRPLRDQMEKWSRRARVLSEGKGKWPIDEARRAELLRRHAGRH